MPKKKTTEKAISANQLELLQIAESVAAEKRIDQHEILESINQTITAAVTARYGKQQDIRCEISPETGEISAKRYRLTVEEIQDLDREILLSEAQKHDHELNLGDYLIQEVPVGNFMRRGTIPSRGVLRASVREAERAHQYETFKHRIGEVITGSVTMAHRGNIHIETQQGEAILNRDQAIPRENFRVGDRVKAIIVDVQNEHPGPQVIISRTSPEFLIRLLEQEIPDVHDGTIKIMRVARDPGSRAKIAVSTNQERIDPVGACIGVRGSRIQTICNELHGERIDVMPWSADPEVMIMNAMKPAIVEQVIFDPSDQHATVIVPNMDNNQSKAIGRAGQNVRLASSICGHTLTVLNDEEYSEQETKRREQQIKEFQEKLSITEQETMILASRQYHDIIQIAHADPDEFLELGNIEPERLREIHEIAKKYNDDDLKARVEFMLKNGMNTDLVDFCVEVGLQVEHIEQIYNYRDPHDPKAPQIRNLQQFSELTTYDLMGDFIQYKGRKRFVPGIFSVNDIDEADAGDLIMNARVNLGQYKVEEIFGEDENPDAEDQDPEGIDPERVST